MENKGFYVPPLTVVLEEQNFFLSEKSSLMVKRLDEPAWNIFCELHRKKIISKIEYEPLLFRNKFLVICKVFFRETKYFKLIFRFSLNGDFLGILLRDRKLEVLDKFSDFSDFEIKLKWSLLREIYKGNFGVHLEKDYNSFLEIFKINNLCCIGFENTTNDKDFDPFGIDFRIKFKNGLMPLQVKGSNLYVEKHEKLHPGIPLVVSYVGEEYSKREVNLLSLADKYFNLKTNLNY